MRDNDRQLFEMKRTLYAELLYRTDLDELTDPEVDLMFALSEDHQIKDHLDRAMKRG